MSNVSDDDNVITLGKKHSPSYQLAVIHGFGMHNELYRIPVESMLQEGSQARIYNIPGHGAPAMPVATMGPTVSGQALRTLVDRIVSNIEDLHDSEIYVLGESLGCVVASQVANRLNAVGKPPAGVILASPPLVLKPLTLLRWSVSPLRRPRSTFKDGVDIEEALEEMIGDPVLASQIIEDPAVARHVSMRYVFDAVISLVGMAISDIRRIHAPLLTLIGENDPLVSQASLALVACLAPSEDNTGLVIERARHSLFWDPETAKVCEVIRDWMYRRDTGNGK